MAAAPHRARAPSTPPAVGPREAKGLLEEGAVLVDVREAWELQELRVPGAIHVPLMELPSSLGRLPQDRTLVMICRTGARSDQAARMLAASGHDDVVNLDGGIVAWHAEGLPTARGTE